MLQPSVLKSQCALLEVAYTVRTSGDRVSHPIRYERVAAGTPAHNRHYVRLEAPASEALERWPVTFMGGLEASLDE